MHSILTSDTELIEQLHMGDKVAFQKIYDRYWNRLYRVAVSKVRVTENAKEIVQDIFLDLWQRHQESHINDLERYLFSAVKYKVLDFFKKEVLRKQYADTMADSLSEADWETEEALAYSDLQQTLLSGIDQLPPKTKLIFELNRIQYKSAEEIAQLMGIPLRTVEYHISQGLKTLRHYLKDYLITFWLICISLF